MTLISVYNSDGCVGRCDAKCYDAITPECDCICGGRNHGAGKSKAIENTREHVEEWIEAYKKRKGIVGGHSEIAEDLFQLSMF